MRFILMHKTNAHWESGATPTPELIERVGALLGEMAKSRALLGAEGLRASALGARLTFTRGEVTSTRGPFRGDNELPAGFVTLRTESLEEAAEWAARLAKAAGDLEIDVRPVTEPWDIGMAPEPATKARRYMALQKADVASEAGERPTAGQQADSAALAREMAQAGVLVAAERLEPSRKGRRYKNSDGKLTVVDGPFTESKELIAGYVIVEAGSLDEAMQWARRYIEAVGADEVDVRLLAEPA